MITFALVTVLVCGASVGVGLVTHLRGGTSLDDLGRGGIWFAHEDDLAMEHRPSQDGPDVPLPKRPLRARF